MAEKEKWKQPKKRKDLTKKERDDFRAQRVAAAREHTALLEAESKKTKEGKK